MNRNAGGRKHGFWWQMTTAQWFWRAKTLPPSLKLRRDKPAAWLLALGFVVAGVTARCGDAPPAPPRPKPKSTAAASLTIFRQALTLAVLVLLSGCATSSHKVTGTLRPEVPPDTVKIFHAMPPHAQVIGVVTADSFAGVDLKQATDDAISKLKDQAGKLGANGLVINVSQDKPLSGAELTGQAIYVSP
jgi:hypothetical protein